MLNLSETKLHAGRVRSKSIIIIMLVFILVTSTFLERIDSMPLLFSDEALAVSTIWQEARGEPFLGKLAVAQVIRNRVLLKYNSDGTVAGTVLAPYQFSGWNTKDPNRVISVSIDTDDPVVDACRTAWLLANQKGVGDKFPAVLFHASTMKEYPEWSKSTNVKRIAEIGNHIFYVDET